MGTQENEVKYLFLNGKNQEPLPMSEVKQENFPVEEPCPLTSPTFEPPVKRSLTDSRHDMAPQHLKRFKQSKEGLEFWGNKERILFTSKASLRQIVSEVANSIERNDSKPSESFGGKEKLDSENFNRTSPDVDGMVALQREEQVFESSPQVAAVTKNVNNAQKNLDASPSSGGRRNENISMLSVSDQPQAETAMPILRTLKSRNSGANEGFAIDHEFFPKLVGVHSISSPTALSPEVESCVDLNQDMASLPPMKHSQKKATNNSHVHNTDNTGNLNYDSETDSDLVSPISPDENNSQASPLSRCSQNPLTDDFGVYTREVHASCKLQVQDQPRELPIVPLAPATHYIPAFSTNMPPALGVCSGPRIYADNLSVREQTTWPRQRSPVDTFALSALGQPQKGTREKVAVNRTQVFSEPTHVSSTVMHSNKQTPCTSSKNIKSVNMKEVVNIYRMAASGVARTSQIRNQPAPNRSSLPSKTQYDLLFSFTKPNGKSDLFLVVKDEVFAVKRFDYKGESYLIHTNNKGKTSILAKLPEEEKLKLQNVDASATRSHQLTGEGGRDANKTSSGPQMTSQHPTETSLSIAALQNSFARSSSHADTSDTASSISSQRLDSDAIHRALRGNNIEEQAKSLNVNGVLSEDETSKRGNHSPTTLLENKRLLLKQVLNGLRTEISNQGQAPPRTTWPAQTVAAGQQCSSWACRVTQVKTQGIYVFSNTHSTPRCSYASSSTKSSQKCIVNPNQVARSQENNATSVNSQRQYTHAAAGSSVREIHVVNGGQQSHFEKQTANEGIHKTFDQGNALPTSERRALQRSDLINFLTRRLASKERASSGLTSLDHIGSSSRRSDGTRQSFSRTSAHEARNVTSFIATSDRHEELSQNQQFRQLIEVLVRSGIGKATLPPNAVNAAALARQKSEESSRVAQTPTASSATPSHLKLPYGVMDHDAESTKKGTTTATVGQQRPYSLMRKQRSPHFTRKNAALRMPLSQSRNVANVPLLPSGANFAGFLQGIERPSNHIVTDGEQNIRRRVSNHVSHASSDRRSFMSQTSERRKLFPAIVGQLYDTNERPLGKTSKVSKQFVANIASGEAAQETTPSDQGQPIRATVTGQQKCTEYGQERGTTKVVKSFEVAKPLDSEKDAADDDVVEMIDPPSQGEATHVPNMPRDEDRKGDINDQQSDDGDALPESTMAEATPFNCNEHETEVGFPSANPVEEDATDYLNSASRIEIEKKIQTTYLRIAQEKSEWKKKYLYKLKSELEKKLSEVSGAAEVIVIDDD